MDNNCFLKTVGIYKSFGPTRALIDVSIDVNRGEIRGLIGENGSGKSTLCSIIAGAQKKDEGKMYVNGQEYDPVSMVDAQEQGISMVVQEVGTIPGITVASNIFVGKLDMFTKNGILKISDMNKAAKEILMEIGTFTMKMLSAGLVSLGLSTTIRDITTGIFLLVLLVISSNQGRISEWRANRERARLANEEYMALTQQIQAQ